MKPTHWYSFAVSSIALICLTVVLVWRPDVDATYVLTIFAVIATGVPIGVAGVNGWRERYDAALKRESDTQRLRKMLREELNNQNPGDPPATPKKEG